MSIFSQCSLPTVMLILCLLLLQQVAAVPQRKDDQPQFGDQQRSDHVDFLNSMDWEKLQYGKSFDVKWTAGPDQKPNLDFGSPDKNVPNVGISIGSTEWPKVYAEVELKERPPTGTDFYFTIFDHERETWEFSPRLTFNSNGQAEAHEEPFGRKLDELLHWKDPNEFPLSNTKDPHSSTTSTEESSTTEGGSTTTSTSASETAQDITTTVATTSETTGAPQATSSSAQPVEETLSPVEGPEGKTSGLPMGAKIGIGVGAGLAALILFMALGMFCYRRRQRQADNASRGTGDSPFPQPHEKYPWQEPTLPNTQPPYEAPSTVPVELAAEPVFIGKTQDVDELFLPREQHPMGARRFYNRWSRG